ncbi:MAG: hypothetical protein JO184_06915 [Gammaproteobacteria bacterium]|nr:hypothetical protein [Gammaproteobacteria bacterium]MBV8307015.1 hypothetical protein [Gammaproteobacteria bacterium]MBV8403164.1 hypothetical protein [Gammaproteobacteria bacterium]
MSVEQNQELGGIRTLCGARRAEAREFAVTVLWAELDVAGTFVAVAETATDRATVLRHVTNAWMALKAAQGYAEQLDLDSRERRAFRETQSDLCRRLVELQYSLLD